MLARYTGALAALCVDDDEYGPVNESDDGSEVDL